MRFLFFLNRSIILHTVLALVALASNLGFSDANPSQNAPAFEVGAGTPSRERRKQGRNF